MRNHAKHQSKLEHVNLLFSFFQITNPKLHNTKNERWQTLEGIPKVDMQLQAKNVLENFLLNWFRQAQTMILAC